jgi:hypothetical protein
MVHSAIFLSSFAQLEQLGFCFSRTFHVINAAVPDFSIDFSDSGYGEYGRRLWYELYTFSTSKDCAREMQYASACYGI